MPRLYAILLLLPLALLADAPGAGEWKYDVIHRKKGEPLRGLVVEESARTVKFRMISRKPGSATLVFSVNVPRDEIARIDALGAEDRAQLKGRLDSLVRERETLIHKLLALDPGAKTATPADRLDLETVPWPGDEKMKALRYKSNYFELIADTRPELAQLAAIHLEQIYAAYARALPARAAGGKPTTILLTRSLAEYRKMALDRGLKLANPAFYDSNKNQVVCGSDLDRMSADIEYIRAQHAKLRETIKDRRAELAKVYKNKIPAELLAPMAEAEKSILEKEGRNNRTFALVRDRLFQRLYHEAFHAYLNTFVYPAKDGPLPLWFNEGLAQIFESAIVEVGELRVGHAEKARLTAVRQAVAADKLLSLRDLLLAEAKDFQIAHVRDKQASDRHYLAAWALTFYLTFDKGVLGTKALDDYVAAIHRGTDALLAFRDLVGKPLPEFEKDFHGYLRRLRPDGTTGM